MTIVVAAVGISTVRKLSGRRPYHRQLEKGAPCSCDR
jgi:hypothetical protein